MALSPDELATLNAWLADLTREMDELGRRVGALAEVIDQERSPTAAGEPPPLDG